MEKAQIELCGWKEVDITSQRPPYEDIEQVFKLHKWDLYVHQEGLISIFKYKALRGYTDDRLCCRFMGYITTPQELKILMSQLGMDYLTKTL